MPAILLPLLKTAGLAFLTKLIGASVSEKIIAQLFFALADWLAKHSDNKLDDETVEQIRKAYFGNENNSEPGQQ